MGIIQYSDYDDFKDLNNEIVEQYCSIRQVPNGHIFYTQNGWVMMKIRNKTINPLANVNANDMWAVDMGNGQIYIVDAHEEVRYIGENMECERVYNIVKKDTEQ